MPSADPFTRLRPGDRVVTSGDGGMMGELKDLLFGKTGPRGGCMAM